MLSKITWSNKVRNQIRGLLFQQAFAADEGSQGNDPSTQAISKTFCSLAPELASTHALSWALVWRFTYYISVLRSNQGKHTKSSWRLEGADQLGQKVLGKTRSSHGNEACLRPFQMKHQINQTFYSISCVTSSSDLRFQPLPYASIQQMLFPPT